MWDSRSSLHGPSTLIAQHCPCSWDFPQLPSYHSLCSLCSSALETLSWVTPDHPLESTFLSQEDFVFHLRHFHRPHCHPCLSTLLILIAVSSLGDASHLCINEVKYKASNALAKSATTSREGGTVSWNGKYQGTQREHERVKRSCMHAFYKHSHITLYIKLCALRGR